MLHDFINWVHGLVPVYLGWVENWGYPGIIILMAMESSIFPVPSEIVVPPAAFMAAQGGKMSFWGVVLAGTFGSWLGATVTYWVSMLLGRVVIVKWGKYFFVSEEKLVRAEQWIHRYEAGGIFFARLLPVVRHLISIPAGIIRMKFSMFSLMTVVGSFIWCWVLAVFGEKAYKVQPDLIEKPEALIHFIKSQSLGIIAVIGCLTALYFLVMWLTAPRKSAAAE
jgi:membrane protein DedA with SNARE-associated domain